MRRPLARLAALFVAGRKTRPLRARVRDALPLLAALVAIFALAGGLVLVLGLIPINASSGHWGITSRFLDFASDRTVATWSLGTKAPPLDAPALVVKGAGHFDLGCRGCHGAPGAPPSRIAGRMTPPPPPLHALIEAALRLEPRELFYIVRHGIKFTAMPAWPSPHREDEVWAMVAFLRTLPHLDETSYRKLAGLPAPGPEFPTADPVRAGCDRCHGADGLGRGAGAFPRLAGQRAAYLEDSLRAYASGARHSGIMEPIAAALSPEEIVELAAHYAALPARPPPPVRIDEAAIERGRRIALEGIEAQSVPSCADCHGPGHPTDRHYPVLAGQYADYLALQLELFARGARGGSARAHLMDHVAGKLDPAQIRDVALFYEALAPP